MAFCFSSSVRGMPSADDTEGEGGDTTGAETGRGAVGTGEGVIDGAITSVDGETGFSTPPRQPHLDFLVTLLHRP